MSGIEKAVVAGLVVGVVAGGYFLYRAPQVRELFQSRPVRPPSSARPAPVRRPEPAAARTPTEAPPSSPAPVPRQSPEPHRPEPDPAPARNRNPEENQLVARTLLQIMAARGLASGISLSVSDTQIEVNGETASAENRAAILEILEKGRGSRLIAADHLMVRSP